MSADSSTAITSLPNSGAPNTYLVWYNDGTTKMLDSGTRNYKDTQPLLTPSPSDPDKSFPRDHDKIAMTFTNSDVQPGSIVASSALAATVFNGTMNVYAVLAGTPKNSLLVCKVSPGFELTTVGSQAPLASAFSIAAASNSGGTQGTLFYLGMKSTTSVKLYSLHLPGNKMQPTQVNLSLGFNSQSYLGAAYGTLSDATPQAYCVVQADDNGLHMCSEDGQIQKVISGDQGAWQNTPIACVFVGSHMVVYYFNPVGSSVTSPSGTPLMRSTTGSKGDTFVTNSVPDAPLPNGYTQLTAIVAPALSNTDGSSATVFITYQQTGSNELVTAVDNLTF